MIDSIENLGSLILSAISTVIAIISLYKSLKAGKLQNQINELELMIKRYEIGKIEKESEGKTCVDARVISLGQGKYRMKIWNSGNLPAYNVTAKFEGDPQIIIHDQEKQPFDILEPRKNYDLALVVYTGSSRKFKIITEWEDSSGEKHSKKQMGDL